MKIEDLKVGRVYRAKRPRVVHTLGGSYINDRQILYISPFEETIQYDSPKVGFGSRYPVIKGNGDFWATLELETEKNND